MSPTRQIGSRFAGLLRLCLETGLPRGYSLASGGMPSRKHTTGLLLLLLLCRAYKALIIRDTNQMTENDNLRRPWWKAKEVPSERKSPQTMWSCWVDSFQPQLGQRKM